MGTDVAGRVALVTGDGSGIGAACVRTSASRGAWFAVVDLLVKNAERVAAEVRDQGFALAADIVSAADISRVVEARVGHFDPLSIAVNNAGVGVLNKAIVTDTAGTNGATSLAPIWTRRSSQCALSLDQS